MSYVMVTSSAVSSNVVGEGRLELQVRACSVTVSHQVEYQHSTRVSCTLAFCANFISSRLKFLWYELITLRSRVLRSATLGQVACLSSREGELTSRASEPPAASSVSTSSSSEILSSSPLKHQRHHMLLNLYLQQP